MIDKFWEFVEYIITFILCKIFRLKITEKKLDSFIQFVKFGIVGLSNTAFSYVLYVSSLFIFQRLGVFPKIDYLVAHIIAFALSVLWSFYWNNKYVFGNSDGKRNILQALLKTYLSYSFTGLFLNSVLSIVWVEVFHWSKLIAPIANLLISVPLNFIMNKFWAFKEKRE